MALDEFKGTGRDPGDEDDGHKVLEDGQTKAKHRADLLAAIQAPPCAVSKYVVNEVHRVNAPAPDRGRAEG